MLSAEGLTEASFGDRHEARRKTLLMKLRWLLVVSVGDHGPISLFIPFKLITVPFGE